MNSEEIKSKGEKVRSGQYGFSSMGQSMFEMMSKCCAGQDGLMGCSSEIEGMMQSMKKKCCRPDIGAAESERKKK